MSVSEAEYTNRFQINGITGKFSDCVKKKWKYVERKAEKHCSKIIFNTVREGRRM
jgi:hypothetical protein